jgi:hypothetical protein
VTRPEMHTHESSPLGAISGRSGSRLDRHTERL